MSDEGEMRVWTSRMVRGSDLIAEYERRRRDRLAAETKRVAEACDCWRVAGPICAKCQLAQVMKGRNE